MPGTRPDAPDCAVVAIDDRSVLAEVVSTRFGVSTAPVFPQFQPDVLGLMRTA